jgi:hypothetical protein
MYPINYQPGCTTDTTGDKMLKQLIIHRAVTAGDPESVRRPIILLAAKLCGTEVLA